MWKIIISHPLENIKINNVLIVFVFLLVYVLSGRPELLSTREISTGLAWLYARRFSGLRYAFTLSVGLFVPSYFVDSFVCEWFFFCVVLCFLMFANQLSSNDPRGTQSIFIWVWLKWNTAFSLAKSLRHDHTFVFSERKSQGLQEPDNKIFGFNASVSATGNS